MTDSTHESGDSLPLDTSPISSDRSTALACHINITRSTDSEAVEPPNIGFSIVIYHNYDAEVGGPLREPLRDTIKKGRFYFTKTNSPKIVADRLGTLAQPPRCNGKWSRSPLQTAQRR